MADLLSPTQIEWLKRQAKQHCRDSGSTHGEALDLIATRCGYRNWSLLMRSNTGKAPAVAAARPPLEFKRLPEDMRKAQGAPKWRKGAPDPSGEILRLLPDLCFEFSSACNALDFAKSYMESLVASPRKTVAPSSQAYHEMRRWLPYCIHPTESGNARILVNRHYKPVGATSNERVVYETYPHLHLQPDPHRLREIAVFSHAAVGDYLYEDACVPWHKRTFAKDYLQRLNLLRELLAEPS